MDSLFRLVPRTSSVENEGKKLHNNGTIVEDARTISFSSQAPSQIATLKPDQDYNYRGFANEQAMSQRCKQLLTTKISTHETQYGEMLLPLPRQAPWCCLLPTDVWYGTLAG